MKRIITSIAIAIATAFASSGQAIPEIEFDNTPVWLDTASKTLKQFERPQANTATRLTSIYSAESLAFVSGITSNTRFDLKKLPKIYVKLPTSGADPSSEILFASLIINKKKMQREYVTAKGGIAGTATTLSNSNVDFKKVKEGVYEVVFSAPLKNGEYAFSNKANRVFCFTVYDGYDDGQTQGVDKKGNPIIHR